MMSNHTKQTEEEFELFWTERCCGLGIECVLTRLINGDYCDIKAYYAWIGWKESRESMKAIKLPEATFETPSGDNALREDAVIEAITSAGYEVE